MNSNIVNIIVPTHKRYAQLKKTLNSIKNQTYQNIKTFVCSDGYDKVDEDITKEFGFNYEFTDKHYGWMGYHPRVHVLNKLSPEGFVCFVDDDNTIDNKYVEKLLFHHLCGDYALTYGSIFYDITMDPVPNFDNYCIDDPFCHGQIDSLCIMVKTSIAKKCSESWLSNRIDGNDFSFISECEKYGEKIFINDMLGKHGQDLKINVVSCCWNEEDFLPYFLDYYSSFCDKITIFDNYSTDRSEEIMMSYKKVDIKKYKSNGFDEGNILEIKNEYYKQERYDYDWTIVVDIDEILYNKNIIIELKKMVMNRVTFPRIIGYNMFSDFFPVYDGDFIFKKIKHGKYDKNYNKNCIFSPSKIDINYVFGCHSNNCVGEIKKSNTCLYLLHYKFLGYDYFKKKYNTLFQRNGKENIKNNLGIHYNKYKNISIEEYKKYGENSENIVDKDFFLNFIKL